MGGRLSVPEEVYSAVKAGDLAKLQSLADHIRQQAQVTGAAPQQQLSWQDVEGRTALHVAAHRNHLRHVEVLLGAGADVHLNSGSRATSGTPLHDAVHGKHDLMVDLLLRHGANPFVENLAGKTPYDIAVDSGNLAMIRKLERCSIYAAYISFKVLAFKGFATAAKDRWCVVLPRYLMQQPGQAYITVRVMLWLYRDAASVEPRTKVWLDGASVVQGNPAAREAALRLHPNHEQPPNVYCKYAQGWTMYFSPAVGGGEPAVSLQQYQHFVAACASPLAPGPQPSAAPAAAAGGGMAYPPVPPAAGPTGGAGAAAAGAGGAVRPPASWSSAPMAAAPAPPSSAAAPPGATPTAAAAPSPWSPLAAGGSLEEGSFAARPGESDEEFARRLSSHLNLSDTLPSSRHSSSSNPFLSPPHSGAPSQQHTPVVQQAQQQQNPFQRPGQQQQAQPAAQPPVPRLNSSAPSAPPAPTGMAAAATAMPLPTALVPPAAGVTGGSGREGSTGEDDGQCVICLSEPKEVALLHGDDAHKCVCRGCAPMVRIGQPCPMCRRPVERLVRLYA